MIRFGFICWLYSSLIPIFLIKVLFFFSDLYSKSEGNSLLVYSSSTQTDDSFSPYNGNGTPFDVISFSAGDHTSLFIDRTAVWPLGVPHSGNDSTLWGMGWNQHGIFGDGTTQSRNLMTGFLTGQLEQGSAGYVHSIFMTRDGSAWTSGFNLNGQLGDGTQTNRTKPYQVISSGVVSVTAGA